MTAASADRGDRPVHRILMWLGHYYPRVSPAIYVLVLVAAVVGLWITPNPPLAFAYGRGAAMFIILGMGLSRDFIHDRNLCLRDLNETPLMDPQAAVDKHLAKLRFRHYPRWSLTITALVGAIGGGLLLGSTGIAYSWPWPARVAITALTVTGVAIAVRIDRSHVIHDRLQPWCPWCRPRGGGDSVKPPTPTPSGTITT